MFGFDIIVNRNNSNFSGGGIFYKNISCINHFIHKFEKDKLFNETDDYIIILDGVVLNRIALQEKHNQKTWFNTIIYLYENGGETFFSSFRGSFAGALFDKKVNKWIIFSDQLGTKFVYYCKVGNFFCCSEVMGNLYNLLRENGVNYNLDSVGARMLLSYGFMLEDITLCKEIKKIRPGRYIVLEDGVLTEHIYYSLSNKSNYNISENDAIENIDKLFRQAVDRQFKKDIEYNYEHLCALSAGLDCRMTSFVAHSMGYIHQTNITFSQSGYYDDWVSKNMATDLGHDWIFKTLDYGNWLMDVDEVNKTTGGNVLYYGTAHGNSLLKNLNFLRYGILHSGQLGDVTIATHSKTNEEPFILGDGAYSKDMVEILKQHIKIEYPNKELGLWYCRYLNGTNNGQQNEYNYTETVSPFLDLDFLEYALSIPTEMRHNHYLYKKWIVKKYPHAANYIWTGMNDKISAKTIRFRENEYSIKEFCKKVLNTVLHNKNHYWDSKFNMNPVGYYIRQNKELLSQIKEYQMYASAISDDSLKKEIDRIFQNNNSIELIQLHTLMSAIKLFFI